MPTDPKTIAWYEQNAENYAQHVRNRTESIFHSMYEKPAMYALVPDLQGKAVLSLGCGSGEDSEHLRQLGAHSSVGIDISRNLIEIAKASQKNCEFHAMDMEQLTFDDESFDFVYASLSIHYLEDWTQVLQGVRRVLKPGGQFLFSCGHPVNGAMEIAADGSYSLAIIKKAETGITIKGDYLNRHKLYDGFGPNSVDAWHKSLSDIFTEIRQANFMVDQIAEPQPLDEMKGINPEVYEWLCKIPQFIIFKLVKIT